MMTAVAEITRKHRRAMRNGTGATFSIEQLKALAAIGVLDHIARVEVEELCPAKTPHTSSAIGGSTSAATESRQIGRLPGTPPSRQVIYRSTHKKLVDDAKAALDAFFADQKAKQPQHPTEARVIPLMGTYWQEKGRKVVNHDQTARSIRTVIGFLMQDESGVNAVVTDLIPAWVERFREWCMGEHNFLVPWKGSKIAHNSPGVGGATVDPFLNDLRAAVNYAEDNVRILFSSKIKSVDPKYRSKPRERVLTIDELARITWYSFHFPDLFRFVALQIGSAVRPDAAMQFDPRRQYNSRTRLIDLQPDEALQTKKRNAILPAIRPLRPVLLAWGRSNNPPVKSRKKAWRTMRNVLGLSDDVLPKTIRHTIATLLYSNHDVPERQVSELLGHTSKLERTTRIYAKYDPAMLREAGIALSSIWIDISRTARAYSAVHEQFEAQDTRQAKRC
jgi:integrase